MKIILFFFLGFNIIFKQGKWKGIPKFKFPFPFKLKQIKSVVVNKIK